MDQTAAKRMRYAVGFASIGRVHCLSSGQHAVAPMELVAILSILALGAAILYAVWRIPAKTAAAVEATRAEAANVAANEATLQRLVELRLRTREVFEAGAVRRPVQFDTAEREALDVLRTQTTELWRRQAHAAPEAARRLLERYLEQHVQIIEHVLSATEETLPQALLDALKMVMTAQAAEASSHPIAVLERRLATGRPT